MRSLSKIPNSMLASWVITAFLTVFSSSLLAQLPDLSPTELANRHEAMVQKIKSAHIITDMIYATDPGFNETTQFWFEGDECRFIVEPNSNALSCQDGYFDGVQLHRIQRANRDVQVPAKVSQWESSGLIGIIQKDTDINQLNYTLWVSMLRFRLNIFDRDWSLPELVNQSMPPATSAIVTENGRELYALQIHHAGIKTNLKVNGADGGILTIYLDPNRNFAAVRVESETTQNLLGAEYCTQWFVTSQGDWVRSGDIWIPTDTLCSCMFNGKWSQVTREYQINVVQLNQPIAPGVMEMRFPENMIVSEMDSAGITHDMHLIDSKGAFKKTFKTQAELHSWQTQQMLGGPFWSSLLSKWPFFAGGMMGLLFLFFLWRLRAAARGDRLSAQSE